MADESAPQRRPTDPKPGTRGPQRGSNDAFKVNEALQRQSAPEPSKEESKPVEGYLAKERREGIELQLKKATAFKKGGVVRGWGKARVKR